MRECDYLIVGAGIAGTSAAYHMSAEGKRCIILEREEQPGFHSTGRSAAVFLETYGPLVMRIMSMVSGPFLRSPPAGFSEVPLLHPRGLVLVARRDQLATLEAAYAELSQLAAWLKEIGPERARELAPALRPGYAAAAIHDDTCMDMDVNAIHQGYIRGARAKGTEIVCNAEVLSLERKGGTWRAKTPAGEFSAPVVINAAGAWADVVGEKAGARAIGLQPKRRTVIVFDPPAGTNVSKWAALGDCQEQFYWKPDAGRILASPADETPVPPQDIQPDEMDIALVADRIEKASTLKIGRILRRWAGLRSFVKDKCPVVGFAPDAEGFFWLAGQGGYGIQTSYAMGMTAAALAAGRGLPEKVKGFGVTEAELGPERLWH